MKATANELDAMPVIASREEFDRASGSLLERLFFNNRLLMLLGAILLTVGLGFEATRLEINASFEKMMPRSNPFIQNYLKYAPSLRGLGSSVRIVVENTKGDIYDPAYLEVLRKINDQVFLIPGVDRGFMKSLWTPVVRWVEINEEGYKGGPVMPDTYSGSRDSVEALRFNVNRSGIVGSLVANDHRSSMIFVPLLNSDAVTGRPLDYKAFRDELHKIRAYEKEGVRIHIVGFAQLVGDLIHGLIGVFTYFFYAAVIATGIIFLYTRCVRSTLVVVGKSLVGVLWLLGLMRMCGLVLDPYSILMPFLIFAIGVSHGSQKMNGIMQDIGRGTDRYVAARYTFRRLFVAGVTALLADAVGFAVLAVIDIPVIRELAISASIGVAVLIVTNLILLPIMLSYTGVSPSAAKRSLKNGGENLLAGLLGRFAQRRWANAALAVTAVMVAVGLVIAGGLKIGDLDPGAPELRPDSQYNRDNGYITGHYGLSSDQFAVIVTTPENGVDTYETLLEMDRLEEELRELPGVQTTVSTASLARLCTSASFEGSEKWVTINRDKFVNNDAVNQLNESNPEMLNRGRSVAPIIAYLADHKAETLARVVQAVEAFADEHNAPERRFLLAAGSSGIEAATNISVSRANRTMLFFVYGAVMLLCFITFKSWRAVVVAIVPLVVTSILCEALMAVLGIGVKVATLPVTALGVGIGVDYALYLLAVQLAYQREGLSVRDAYRRAVTFTGQVVALIGVTLAAAVVTWYWSPIKFQADMGILLAFMFLWNMVGALVLIPSLSAYLLRPISARELESEPGREEAVELGSSRG